MTDYERFWGEPEPTDMPVLITREAAHALTSTRPYTCEHCGWKGTVGELNEVIELSADDNLPGMGDVIVLYCPVCETANA
jgi:hypothetical protein